MSVRAAFLAFSPVRRYESLVVGVIGGLSILVAGLYLWAVHVVAASGSRLIAPTSAYAIWMVLTVASAGVLWWHQQRPVTVFVAVFVLYAAGSVLIRNAGLGGLALPLWYSVYAVAAYARLRTGIIVLAAGWVVGVSLQVSVAAAVVGFQSVPTYSVAALSSAFF